MTKVKFYMEPVFGVFAYFPEILADNKGNMTCYAHIGQHSACSPDYLKGKKLATPYEYNDLLNELIGQGYDDLQVIDSRTTLSKIVCEVSCKYGAPMGRANTGTQPDNKKIFDKPVPMGKDAGYDKGGAYWGLGKQLRVKFTKDMSYIEFYRK